LSVICGDQSDFRRNKRREHDLAIFDGAAGFAVINLETSGNSIFLPLEDLGKVRRS